MSLIENYDLQFSICFSYAILGLSLELEMKSKNTQDLTFCLWFANLRIMNLTKEEL